jgi:hypothetical protein
LPVERILSCIDGAPLIHCELPDGSIAAFPSWMMDVQACSRLTEGSPQLSLEALASLRRFLSDKLSDSQKSSEPTPNIQGEQQNEQQAVEITKAT